MGSDVQLPRHNTDLAWRSLTIEKQKKNINSYQKS